MRQAGAGPGEKEKGDGEHVAYLHTDDAGGLKVADGEVHHQGEAPPDEEEMEHTTGQWFDE